MIEKIKFYAKKYFFPHLIAFMLILFEVLLVYLDKPGSG